MESELEPKTGGEPELAGAGRRRVLRPRIPFMHARVEWPELVQGLIVAGATGLAIVPLFEAHFGMSFEIAVALCVVQSVIICSAFLIFGEPFCPGWLTPALPLVLAAALAREAGPERASFVTAVVLLTGAIFLGFGLTGLGPLFVRCVPSSLRSGIILGAGLSALLHELPREGAKLSRLESFPISISIAVGVSLLLLFSRPVESLRRRSRLLAAVAGLGMAPGFLIALVAAAFVGEADFSAFRALFVDAETDAWHLRAADLFFLPDFGGLWSRFGLFGAESGIALRAEHFIAALPLAFTAYVIGFGDLVTGSALIESAAAERGESVPLDPRRTHISVGLRNGAQVLFCGPFFPLQGVLWTGAMVVVAERYRRGPRAMQSIYSGVLSYYVFGIPVFYFFRPLLLLYQPVLAIALSLTLFLTGFACAYVALSGPKDRVARGVTVLTGTLIAVSTTWGLLVGFLLAIALEGRQAWDES